MKSAERISTENPEVDIQRAKVYYRGRFFLRVELYCHHFYHISSPVYVNIYIDVIIQTNCCTMNVEHEVQLLVEEITRLGAPNSDGKLVVKFGVLFADDRCANLFEALVGTLKAAKRKKIVTYDAELLLQGVHDNVDILLL